MKSNASRIHILFATVTMVFTVLLILQVRMWPNGEYPGDIGMHVQFVTHPEWNEAAGYSLLHVLAGVGVSWFAGTVVDPTTAAQLSFFGLLSLSFYVSLTLVYRFFARRNESDQGWRAAGFTIAVFFVSMLIPNPAADSLYVGAWSPNPWHNPTYLFARVFSLWVLFSFLEIIAGKTAGSGLKSHWWALAVTAVLSMWAKPSFMLFILPAAGLLLLWLAVRKEKTWPEVLIVGSAFLPSVLVLLGVQQMVFGGNEASNTVVIAPGKALMIYTSNLPLAIFLGSAFPLFVVLSRIRSLDRTLGLGGLAWVVALTISFLFAESGERFTHVNFVWTYMGGMFVAFVVATDSWFFGKALKSRSLWWGGTLLFSAHLISGVYYFHKILRGGSYF